MPELPEIEHLRRSLTPALVDAAVLGVDLRRPDIVHVVQPRHSGRMGAKALLAGSTIQSLQRHGKNLALVSDEGAVVCIHLGMSGQLCFVPSRQPLRVNDHVHCLWRVRSPLGMGRLMFRDPRRFGGLWPFPSVMALHQYRWSALGPDALTISNEALAATLQGSQRSIKASLLDQSVLAGVGNIYADEALFKARIHPESISGRIPRRNIDNLARAIRLVMRAAINVGGSTIRDYRDGAGRSGGYAAVHKVYGRGGLPCPNCSRPLVSSKSAQRTTVHCRMCQQRV